MKMDVQHGVVFSRPEDPLGYCGWPPVGRDDFGRLYVVASGLRAGHLCPWGKTVMWTSDDNGASWSAPSVINDSPLDDRDAGIICLGGRKMLVSWFTLDIRSWANVAAGMYGQAFVDTWAPTTDTLTDAIVAQHAGAWVRTTEDGGSHWNPPIRVTTSSPHGPIRLSSGRILYLGKDFGLEMLDADGGDVVANVSDDGGQTWRVIGRVPLLPTVTPRHYQEAHVVETADGKLVGLIRFENEHPTIESFSMLQTESTDGGCTWTPGRPLGIYGSPPHLLRHSSGAIVCVYGYRKEPFGQRAMVSWDGGQTWQSDLLLRADGPDFDLGYPSSVELADGRIFTVYYQKTELKGKCSLLWSCWRLPEKK